MQLVGPDTFVKFIQIWFTSSLIKIEQKEFEKIADYIRIKKMKITSICGHFSFFRPVIKQYD